MEEAGARCARCWRCGNRSPVCAQRRSGDGPSHLPPRDRGVPISRLQNGPTRSRLCRRPNLTIDYHFAATNVETLSEPRGSRGRTHADVIVVPLSPPPPAKQATATIPIVSRQQCPPDLVAWSSACCLAVRTLPGRPTPPTWTERLELSRDFPEPSTPRPDWQPATPVLSRHRDDLASPPAHRRSVYVTRHRQTVSSEAELGERRISPAGRRRTIVVHPTPPVGRVYKEIAAFAIAERLPTITGNKVYVREGLLMSYGPDLAWIWRLAAHYTDQLLRGAKAADLPVQQPTRFELVLNLRTARAIGTPPTHAPRPRRRGDRMSNCVGSSGLGLPASAVAHCGL